MPEHLALLDDSLAEFEAAFAIYDNLSRRRGGIRDAAIMVRSLYLAMEKLFKLSLGAVNPYWLVSLKQGEIARLAKLHAALSAPTRPPSILATQVDMRSITFAEAWTLVKAVRCASLPDSVMKRFDEALAKLEKFRNRAQHAELFEEIEDMVAGVTQVFACAPEVAPAIDAGWWSAARDRYPDIESRLRAVANLVDGAWQVVFDRVRSAGGVDFEALIAVKHVLSESAVHVYISGERSSGAPRFMAGATVALASLSGMFAEVLTADLAEVRKELREELRGSDGVPSPVRSAGALMSALLGLPATAAFPAREREPLVPLQPSRLVVPAALGSFSLGRDFADEILEMSGKGSVVSAYTSVAVRDFSIDFPDGTSPQGTVHGSIQPASYRGPGAMPVIEFSGVAHMDLESGGVEIDDSLSSSGDRDGGGADGPASYRFFKMKARLTVP